MNTTFIYYFVSFNISLIYAKFLSGIISLPINFLLLKFLVFPKQTRNYTYDFKSSSELVKFYTEKYLDLDFTGLLANRYHTWKHKLLERGLRGKSFDVVLELGTGEGQHLPFITHSYQTLLMSDIDYPQTELLFRGVENVDLVDFKLQPGRFFAQINCEKIGLPDAFADRVVLTCVLLHLNDPYTALREIRRVLKKNGQVDIYLPNTVGFLYRFLEWIFSFISTKRGNFLYRVYNLIEHKNSAYSIIQLIKFVFAKDKLNFLFFPFFFIKSWNINLFTVIRITKSETK